MWKGKVENKLEKESKVKEKINTYIYRQGEGIKMKER